MKLSILICTILKRREMLKRLLAELHRQIGYECLVDAKDGVLMYIYPQIEILVDSAARETIGQKRNRLLDMAKGEYTCFFDDDDMPGEKYIETIMHGISLGRDCVSLRGVMTTNGINPEIFEHSITYDAYQTNMGTNYPEVKYERFPNHLNPIRADISKQFRFPEKNWGEDTSYATQIYKSGLIKSEFYTPRVIYHYLYVTKK